MSKPDRFHSNVQGVAPKLEVCFVTFFATLTDKSDECTTIFRESCLAHYCITRGSNTEITDQMDVILDPFSPECLEKEHIVEGSLMTVQKRL